MARSKAGFFYVGTIDGSPPAMRWFNLKGATAYYEGAVLRLSATSGSAAKFVAAATSVLGVAGANITSDATTTKMPVFLADAKNLFEAVCVATGAPNTRLYDTVAIRVGSTHNYRIQGTVQLGGATAPVRIIDVDPADASGTGANKKYWVQFVQNQSLLGEADTTY